MDNRSPSRFFGLKIIIVLLLSICAVASGQQVGTSISADGAAPNANAMLDVQSPSTGNGMGILIPRVTAFQRTTASSGVDGGLLDDTGQLRGGPAQGLLVYQTNGSKGLYYNTSTTATPAWKYVGDFLANGSVPMTGDLDMNTHSLTNVLTIDMNNRNVQIGDSTRAYSTDSGSVAIGHSATARYRTGGVAIGAEADGDYNGVALGYSADGQYSNIAIGFASSAYSGYDRIAIGRSITNKRNNTTVLRGTLYLDGGTGLVYRSTVGSGGWTAKAFTIDHPKDPKNKVLRHFSLEGPQVWNVYAGQVKLFNGKATVKLPHYYRALNKAGSEIFSLAVVDDQPDIFPVVKATAIEKNRFTIMGTHDVKVCWTVKALRNDPACLADLKNRPVEQLKSELTPEQMGLENTTKNTIQVSP